MDRIPRETYPEIVARQARDRPDAIFFQSANSQHSVTYKSFHELGLSWANAYEKCGVHVGSRVLVMMSTRLEFFLSFLGLSWLHAVDVPLNTDYRGPILSHAINVAQADLMLIEDQYVLRLKELGPETRLPKNLIVLGSTKTQLKDVRIWTLEEFLEGAQPDENRAPPAFHEISCVIFTSGTTGPSKAVLQPWGQLHRSSITPWPTEKLGEADAFYFCTPIFHIAAKAVPYLMAVVGGRFVFRERFSASEFLDDVRTFGCTWSLLVGAMAPFLMKQKEKPDDAKTTLNGVVMIPVLPNVNAFKRRYEVEVTTCYGMSEISPPFTSADYEVTDENAKSCGTPVGGLEIRLVDEYDYEVPTGEIGELILRSRAPWELNAGYLGMPEATATAWRNGWFHTGDLFRRDIEGRYYFVDRGKDALRRRGENISSFEVEGVVNTHPDVLASAAVAAPSEYSEDEIKICVIRTPGSTLTHGELIEFLTPVMPRFMIPRYVEFMDEFPRTATERVKKEKLRKSALGAATWDRESGTFVDQRPAENRQGTS